MNGTMSVHDLRYSFRIPKAIAKGFRCLDALDEALQKFGKPVIFNTDQGSQFTSHDFTGQLAANGIAISMDGKGRCLDNIFIERWFRSLKSGSRSTSAYGHCAVHRYTDSSATKTFI